MNKYVWCEGREYTIIQEPCLEEYGTGEPCYSACAVDEDGNSVVVYWGCVREEYDPESQDESDACDWDNPDFVVFDWGDQIFSF